MPSTALVETDVQNLVERYAPIIPPGVPVGQMKMSILLACEKTPKLYECTKQSLINSAAASLVLGVLCDGFTGQGYLIPRSNKGVMEAGFQLGLKGIPVIAERAGFVVNRGVILEGDEHDIQLGTGGHVHHKPIPGGRDKRRVVWAWASAEAEGKKAIVDAMDIDEIQRIRGFAQNDKFWSAHFNEKAKCAVVHRLSKAIPVALVQKAAAYDGMVEIGQSPTFDQNGNIRVGGPFPVVDADVKAPATLQGPGEFKISWDGKVRSYPLPKWEAMMLYLIGNTNNTLMQLTALRADNAAEIERVMGIDADIIARIDRAILQRQAQS